MNAPLALDTQGSMPLRDSRFTVPGMRCAGCISKIERGLAKLEGVDAARVNFSAKRVAVRHHARLGEDDLVEAIAAIGFEAQPVADNPMARDDHESAALMRALAVAGFGMMNIMLLSVSVWSGADAITRDMFHWISALIAVPVIAYAGRPFFASAAMALRFRRTNMDVPISIGVLLATGMATLHEVEAADDAGEQVIEVVGDAAGELADGFDLLRLPQGFFDVRTLVHLSAQFQVGLLQRAGALDHEGLELVRSLFAGLDQGAHFILPKTPANGGQQGTGQGDALYRAFQQRNVAQDRDHALTPRADRRLSMLAGQHHERKIGPGRLLVGPVAEVLEILPEQGLFGDEHRIGIAFGALQHFSQAVTHLGLHAAAAQHIGRGRAIPADGGEDDY